MLPMAHDIHGTPIAVPPNATAWRVRRQTAGRPGLILGLVIIAVRQMDGVVERRQVVERKVH